jgi:hypothetical protein
VDKFFRWLSGNQQQPAPKHMDMANTAPLSEQQIQAIVRQPEPALRPSAIDIGLWAVCGQTARIE